MCSHFRTFAFSQHVMQSASPSARIQHHHHHHHHPQHHHPHLKPPSSLSPPSSSLQVVQELMGISQLQTSPHHVDFARRCQSAVANSQSENRPQSPTKATGCLNKNGCSMKHEALGNVTTNQLLQKAATSAGKDQRHTINFESNMESQ